PALILSSGGVLCRRRRGCLATARSWCASGPSRPRPAVGSFPQPCHATMAEPAAATRTAAIVHTFDDPDDWACLAALRASTCSHGDGHRTASPDTITGPSAGLRAESR